MANSHNPKLFFAITILTILVTFLPALKANPSDNFRATVEADWDAQEKRLGRDISSPKAIGAILFAAERLLADLSRKSDASLSVDGFYHAAFFHNRSKYLESRSFYDV